MTKRIFLLAGLAAVASMLTVAPALAGVVTLNPVQDNSIYEEDFLSNGSGQFLFSGNTSFLSARRALLAFDVAGSVPAGATITSVSLELRCNQSPFVNDVPQDFGLHRLTDDWGEGTSDAGNPGGTGAPAANGDATWSERFFGQGMPWAAPGGDYVPSASATATVGTCSATAPATVVFASTRDLIADVQGWVDDPPSSFGWIVIGEEIAATTARRFASREIADPSMAPVLTVEFDGGGGDGGGDGGGVPASSPLGIAALVLLMAVASAFALLRRERGTC